MCIPIPCFHEATPAKCSVIQTFVVLAVAGAVVAAIFARSAYLAGNMPKFHDMRTITICCGSSALLVGLLSICMKAPEQKTRSANKTT